MKWITSIKIQYSHWSFQNSCIFKNENGTLRNGSETAYVGLFFFLDCINHFHRNNLSMFAKSSLKIKNSCIISAER